MNILGLYGYFGGNNPEAGWIHDAGASLFIGGEHICSIAEERLSREKHDGEYPYKSIKYVLKESNLTEKDIDIVCYPRSISTHGERTEAFLNKEFINAKISIVEHHLAHAYAAFYTSPFEVASVYTQDGGGNYSYINPDARNTGTYGIGYKDKGIELIYDFMNPVPNTTIFNIGQIYIYVSVYILKHTGLYSEKELYHPAFSEASAGKIMGLSAYGNAENIDSPDLFWIEDDGFNLPKIKSLLAAELLSQLTTNMRASNVNDLAAWLQKQFEDILVKYFSELKLKEDYLCMGGGCALNVLSNRRLIQEGVFKDIHVFPGTNDSGLAFGGAIYEAVKREKFIKLPENLGLLGKTYSFKEIEATINENFKELEVTTDENFKV